MLHAHAIAKGRYRSAQILPPAIIKPRQLWSGKQLISTIIFNLLPPDRFEPLNIKSEAKVKGSYWAQHSEEGEVGILSRCA